MVQAIVEWTLEIADALFDATLQGGLLGGLSSESTPCRLQDLVHGFMVLILSDPGGQVAGNSLGIPQAGLRMAARRPFQQETGQNGSPPANYFK
jgi:hypothetical protein